MGFDIRSNIIIIGRVGKSANKKRLFFLFLNIQKTKSHFNLIIANKHIILKFFQSSLMNILVFFLLLFCFVLLLLSVEKTTTTTTSTSTSTNIYVHE